MDHLLTLIGKLFWMTCMVGAWFVAISTVLSVIKRFIAWWPTLRKHLRQGTLGTAYPTTCVLLGLALLAVLSIISEGFREGIWRIGDALTLYSVPRVLIELILALTWIMGASLLLQRILYRLHRLFMKNLLPPTDLEVPDDGRSRPIESKDWSSGSQWVYGPNGFLCILGGGASILILHWWFPTQLDQLKFWW